MKHATILLCGLGGVLAIGCNGSESSNVMGPAETQVKLAVVPAAPYAGDPANFTVTVSNDQIAIDQVTIDYTDDGTWDDTQAFDSQAVSATFSHVYPNAGTYAVRAEATDANGKATTGSMILVVVNPPTTVPVSYVLDGVSPQGGGCYAVDPPATCAGCAILVGRSTSLGVTGLLGRFPHGAVATIDQGFNQWPVITGNQTYTCQFFVHLIAGEPGYERPIGSGTCETSSQSIPAQLDCRITAAGQVP